MKKRKDFRLPEKGEHIFIQNIHSCESRENRAIQSERGDELIINLQEPGRSGRWDSVKIVSGCERKGWQRSHRDSLQIEAVQSGCDAAANVQHFCICTEVEPQHCVCVQTHRQNENKLRTGQTGDNIEKRLLVWG